MPPDDPTKTDPAIAEGATPPAETPAAPAIDPAKFVSRDDYDNLRAQLAHMNGQIAGMAATANRQVAPPPDPGPQYTDGDLAEMLESGDGRKILAAQRYINRQELLPIAQEFNTFRAGTIATAESLGRELVESSGKIPYYKDPDIRRQVDAFMNTLPPEARANKESLVLAHNYVVGQPENMDRIVKQRVEEEIRKRAGDAKVPDATATGGRIPASGGSLTPSVKDLLGEGAALALRAQGRSPDEFAKRIGYKNWAEYAAYIEKEQQDNAEEEV